HARLEGDRRVQRLGILDGPRLLSPAPRIVERGLDLAASQVDRSADVTADGVHVMRRAGFRCLDEVVRLRERLGPPPLPESTDCAFRLLTARDTRHPQAAR